MWNYICQDFAVDLYARICVDFDQPAFQVCINHNIDPENFEVICSSFRIDEWVSSTDDINSDLFDLRQDYFEKVMGWIFFQHVFVQLLVR